MAAHKKNAAAAALLQLLPLLMLSSATVAAAAAARLPAGRTPPPPIPHYPIIVPVPPTHPSASPLAATARRLVGHSDPVVLPRPPKSHSEPVVLPRPPNHPPTSSSTPAAEALNLIH
jgi:hypothetical protein